ELPCDPLQTPAGCLHDRHGLIANQASDHGQLAVDVGVNDRRELHGQLATSTASTGRGALLRRGGGPSVGGRARRPRPPCAPPCRPAAPARPCAAGSCTAAAGAALFRLNIPE